MICLSVRQPWAHAIFALGKDVENRSWPTRYRGALVIHAARRLDLARCRELAVNPAALVTGHCLGTVELADCIQGSPSPWAIAGQWHWVLRRPRLWAVPVPLRGRLGLFVVNFESVAGAEHAKAAGGTAS
ncbi:MAG: ASCH domain-containing protein [Terriglobales bacterium]